MKEHQTESRLSSKMMARWRRNRQWLAFLLPGPIVILYFFVGLLSGGAALLSVDMSWEDRVLAAGYFAWAAGGFIGWVSLRNISAEEDGSKFNVRRLLGLLSGVFAVGFFLGTWGLLYLRDLGDFSMTESILGCWPLLLAPMLVELISEVVRGARSVGKNKPS